MNRATATSSDVQSSEAQSSSSVTFQIAVLPGDGIGAEVMAEAERVLLNVLPPASGVTLNLQHVPAGAGEYLKSGNPLPETTLAICQQADAVLLGAMGLPHVRLPDGREMAPQIDLREQLDLYCGLRPIRLYHEADTPLKRFSAGEIDLVIVRENTEGLFSSRQSRPRRGCIARHATRLRAPFSGRVSPGPAASAASYPRG
jgi:3-isopropylmalate dehydrogenase